MDNESFRSQRCPDPEGLANNPPVSIEELRQSDTGHLALHRQTLINDVSGELQKGLAYLEVASGKQHSALADIALRLKEAEDMYSRADEEVKEIDAKIESVNKAFQEKQGQLLDVLVNIQQYFAVDNRVDQLQRFKEQIVSHTMDIISNAKSATRTKRIEQEQYSFTTKLDEIEHTQSKMREACMNIELGLRDTLNIMKINFEKFQEAQKVISSSMRSTHLATVEEHSVQVEMQRLNGIIQAEGFAERIKHCAIQQQKRKKELDTANSSLRKLNKDVGKVFLMRQEHQVSLCLLHKERDLLTNSQIAKESSAFSAIAEREGLKQNLDQIDKDRRAYMRQIYQYREHQSEQRRNLENIEREIASTSKLLVEKNKEVDWNSDQLDMVKSKLTVKLRNKELLTQCEAREHVLLESQNEVASLERRLAKLNERKHEATLKIEVNEELIKEAQTMIQNDKSSSEDLKLTLLDVKNKVVNTKTELIDTNSLYSTLTIEIISKVKAQETLYVSLNDLFNKVRLLQIKRTSVVVDWSWGDIEKRSTEMKFHDIQQLLNEQSVRMEQLQKEQRHHRKWLNEATTKAAQLRRSIEGDETKFEAGLEKCMKCKFELFVFDCERSIYWFLLKLLTKLDVDDASRYVSSEMMEIGVRDSVVDRNEAKLKEYRALQKELQDGMNKDRREVSNLLTLLPQPFTSVFHEKFAINYINNEKSWMSTLLSETTQRCDEINENLKDLRVLKEQYSNNDLIELSNEDSEIMLYGMGSTDTLDRSQGP